MSDHVPSPCISVCALDQNDVCIGCFRTGQEIMEWGRMTNDQRREVLEKIKIREAEKFAR